MNGEERQSRIEALEQRVAAIEARNLRVATAKAWETSLTRRGAILLLTYFVMCLVFSSLGSSTVFSSAAIPTVAFFLSTLSFPVLRSWWVRRKGIEE